MQSRSLWPVAAALGCAMGAAAACNTLTGLDKYEKVDCAGDCQDALSEPAVDAAAEKEASPDVVDAAVEESSVQPEAGLDASPPDAPPTELQRHWARWPMPDWAGGDAGETGTWDYEVQADGGVVHDKATWLWWQNDLNTLEMNYEQAFQYCKTLELDNHTWSLPTRIELESLLSPTTSSLIHPVFNLTSASFWTASPAGSPEQPEHWTVGFDLGTVQRVDDKSVRRVRCVAVK